MESVDLRKERERSRRKEYKESILHAAEKAILRKGFRAVTMDAIAREAQLSKATLYHYFRSKTELIEEILLHFYDDMSVIFEKIQALDITSAEKLRKTILTALEFYDEKENLLMIIMSDSSLFEAVGSVFYEKETGKISHESRFAKGWREKYEKLLDLCAGILKEGVRRGEFRAVDIGFAVTFLNAVLHGLQHIRSLDTPKPDVHKEADMVFDFLTRGISAPRRPIKGEA